MMPMVGALDEVYAAKAIIQAEGEKLDAQGIPWDHAVPIGIMVEIPSIALIADRVAEEVDFVSVGTNDLIQYLCAADRMNPGVRPYYQDYHPALFRLLDILSQTFREAGKPLSICGELGSDPLAVPALVGLGIQKLSMGAAAIARRQTGHPQSGPAPGPGPCPGHSIHENRRGRPSPAHRVFQCAINKREA